MAVEICLLIDDQGAMSVSVDPNAAPAQDGQAKAMPVKSIEEALQAIQQVATEATAQQPQEGMEQMPEAPGAEEQAMEAGYQGKRIAGPAQAGM